MTVAEARQVLFEQECDALINQEKVHAAAIDLAENVGIIFLDEMDKIVSGEHAHGADVSRQGVQRDLLPIVEGTTVQTRYGWVKTDHILFVAAGAFHRAQAERPDARVAGPLSHPRGTDRPDQGRFRADPEGAEGFADEAVPGVAGNRGHRPSRLRTTRSSRWPTTRFA